MRADAASGSESSSSEPDARERRHQEQIASFGTVSDEYLAMIHTSIPDGKVYSIKGAKDSVNAEWDKLFSLESFGMSEVMEYRDCVALYKDVKKEKVHFGTLRALCHEKNAELQLEDPDYKGRVVFRGDQVKDEDGYYAVFSEQGTSASHMAATKFLDAIARLPDFDGEDSDALGAYTQVS